MTTRARVAFGPLLVLAGLIVSRGRAGFHRAGFVASLLGAMALILLGRLLHLG